MAFLVNNRISTVTPRLEVEIPFF